MSAKGREESQQTMSVSMSGDWTLPQTAALVTATVLLVVAAMLLPATPSQGVLVGMGLVLVLQRLARWADQ